MGTFVEEIRSIIDGPIYYDDRLPVKLNKVSFDSAKYVEEWMHELQQFKRTKDIEATGFNKVAVKMYVDNGSEFRRFRVRDIDSAKRFKFNTIVNYTCTNPDEFCAMSEIFSGDSNSRIYWRISGGYTIKFAQVLYLDVLVEEDNGCEYELSLCLLHNMYEPGDFRIYDKFTGMLVVDSRESFAHCGSRFVFLNKEYESSYEVMTCIGFIIVNYDYFTYG